MNLIISFMILAAQPQPAVAPKVVTREALIPIHQRDSGERLFAISLDTDYFDPAIGPQPLKKPPLGDTALNLLSAVALDGFRAGLPLVAHPDQRDSLNNLKLLSIMLRDAQSTRLERRLTLGEYGMTWVRLDRTDHIQLLAVATSNGYPGRINFDWGALNPIRELFYVIADQDRRGLPTTTAATFPVQLPIQTGEDANLILHLDGVLTYDGLYGVQPQARQVACFLETYLGRDLEGFQLMEAWDTHARLKLEQRKGSASDPMPRLIQQSAQATMARHLVTLKLGLYLVHYFQPTPEAPTEMLVLRNQEQPTFTHDLPKELYQFLAHPMVKDAVVAAYQ